MLKKLFVLSLIVFSSVFIFAAISGTVAEVDKYGNVHTDILEQVATEDGFELGDMLEITMGENVLVAPFVTTYGDVDTGTPLVRVSGGHIMMAINYGNFAGTYSLEVGSEVTLEIIEKGAYKEELEIRHLVRTDERDDYASDEVFANFREVKLGNIGEKILYRSCHPSIDDPRAPYANELVEKAGINTVVNLSDSDEELEEYLNYSDYYKSLYEKGNLINLNMGVDLVSDEFASKLKDGLLFIIEKDPPYLVHCVEGKDRAGMVVALLGAIMDASAEDIFSDYVVTYENYYNVQKDTPAYDAVENIIVDIFVSINEDNPVNDENIKEVAIKYLTEKVGLTSDEVEAIKQKLK